jgi:hypothetical protein
MNYEESYEKHLDEVWEQFLVTLAVEKLKMIEKLERQGAPGMAKKGA